MGTEAVIGGLFGLASAGVQAAGAAHAASANAAAQSSINAATMKFNREEAAKARDWQHNEAGISRKFNSAEALAARQFTAAQARYMMDFNAKEAATAREFSSSEADIARKFDAQQSFLARQFEERMSSTAHQREVQDLRAAGLNPILSATGGSGASTPSAPIIGSPVGSSAQASASPVSGASASSFPGSAVAAMVSGLSPAKKANILGEFVSSAREAVRLGIDYKRAEVADKAAEAAIKNAKVNEYSSLWDVEIKRKGIAITEAKAQAEIDKLEADIELRFEEMDIRKMEAEATIEERKAAAADHMSHVEVNNQQAKLLGTSREDLENKIEYGFVIASYLPKEARDLVGKHMIKFVDENKDLIKLLKDAGDGNPSPKLLDEIRNRTKSWLLEHGWKE